MDNSNKKTLDIVFALQLLIALANLALFGLMFIGMGYFELIGSDPAYFDEGTLNNLRYINMATQPFGLTIDPTQPHKITTLAWAVCLGVALVSSFFCIVVANRRPSEAYETT